MSRAATWTQVLVRVSDDVAMHRAVEYVRQWANEFIHPGEESRDATAAERRVAAAFAIVAAGATVVAALHPVALVPAHNALGVLIIGMSVFVGAVISRRSDNDVVDNHGAMTLLAAAGVLQPLPLVFVTVIAMFLGQAPQRRAHGGWSFVCSFVSVTVLCSLVASASFGHAYMATENYLAAMAFAVASSLLANMCLVVVFSLASPELTPKMAVLFTVTSVPINAIAIIFCVGIVAASRLESWLLVALMVPPLATRALELREYATRQAASELMIDPLTQVFNRRYFWQRVEREMVVSRQHGTPLAVMMVDIDHFKLLNDTSGHLEGDRALTCMATALRELVPGVTCRYGGEEFGVILPGVAATELVRVAEYLRQSAAVALAPWKKTVSIGVATLDAGGHDSSPNTFVGRADRALYSAKGSGRNRVALADETPARAA